MRFPRLRTALGLILAATLALPAYTCTGYRGPDGQVVESIPAGADTTGYAVTQVRHWPLEDFDPSGTAPWLTLLAYAWPLLLLAIERARPGFARHWTTSALWLALALASAWWIWVAVVLGDIAHGAVLSFAALAALAAVAAWDLAGRRRARTTP